MSKAINRKKNLVALFYILNRVHIIDGVINYFRLFYIMGETPTKKEKLYEQKR